VSAWWAEAVPAAGQGAATRPFGAVPPAAPKGTGDPPAEAAHRERVILHVDMDAFFAAVEVRDNPQLRGKPLVIGGHPPPWGAEHRRHRLSESEDTHAAEATFAGRGVVTTCSYEARRYGIHAGMPIAEAWRLCPDAVYLPGSHGKYGSASAEVMAILSRFSPDLEPVSVDEAFLDVSGCRLAFGGPWEIAAAIQRQVEAELDLSCSVGIGPNQLLAKMASKMRKPAGIFEIRADQARELLAPMAVEKMHGIGPSTAARLERLGILTLGQLAGYSPRILERQFGPASALALQRLARGEGGRVVRPFGYRREEKSIGQSRTFGRNLSTRAALEAELLDLGERVCRRLRAGGWQARQISLQLRSPDFSNRFRQAPLAAPCDRESEIFAMGRNLLHANWCEGEPLRLLGLSAGRLVPASSEGWQLDLLDGGRADKERSLNAAMDALKADWGRDAVSRCNAVLRRRRR
jgi:DNA polymerase IV